MAALILLFLLLVFKVLLYFGNFSINCWERITGLVQTTVEHINLIVYPLLDATFYGSSSLSDQRLVGWTLSPFKLIIKLMQLIFNWMATLRFLILSMEPLLSELA
jgi:hypothetical protein